MKTKHNKNKQQGHHDDCDDCRKEKKQNQALISIYQRLQAVDNHSKNLRKSIIKHTDDCRGTTQKFRDLSVKLQRMPKQTKTDIQLKNLGYQFAESLMQQIMRDKLTRKRQLLAKADAKINQQNKKSILGNNQKFSINRSFSVNARYQPQVRNIEQTNTLNFSSKLSSNQEDCAESFRSSMISQKTSTIRQPQQTKTTAFYSVQNGEADKSQKMGGLNLWLYQAEFHNLETELYETKKSSRVQRNTKKSRFPSELPTIKSTRNKF